jgi:hypothetical protein
MAAPKVLPAWFVPWTWHRFGLGPRPAFPTHITTHEYKWVLDEWQRFITWEAWVVAGRPGQRPDILWRNASGRAISPTWATRLFRILHPVNPPPPPPPPPPPTSTFPMVPSKTRGRNGLYFYNLQNIEAVARYALQHNLWVGLLVNETNFTPWQDGRRPKEAVWAEARALKNAGVTVVATGWAEPFGDLEAQAAFIGEMYHGGGDLYDEYMLNIEAGWVFEAGYEAFSKSDVFAPKLRAHLGPNVPLSLCPDWGNNIHWRPYLEAGMSAVRWQCYLNEWPHKSPLRAIGELSDRAQHDLPNGIPKNVERGVVYGKYPAHNQPLNSWTAQDDEAGQPPRSVWPGEFALDDPDILWISR